MPTPRTHIVVHHSLTPDSGSVSWAAIEKYHRETNGWRAIGYHKGVESVTENPELAKYRYQVLQGRADDEQASACPQGDMNRIGLHVCCVGNFDLETPSDDMVRVLLTRVIQPWMREYGIPVENIVGHRDFNPHKSCPGVRFDLGLLREMAR